MKQKFLSACFLLMAVCLVAPVQTVQANKKIKQHLTGIWQATRNGQRGLFFKILNADGTFCNFGLVKQDGTFGYSQKGTFKVTSDSTYTEAIEESPSSIYIDHKSTLKFRLSENGKELQIEWFSPETKKWTPETWIKVE